MMFCPKCGSLLMPKKGEKKLVCSCGYESSSDSKIKDTNLKKEKKIEVVEKNIEMHPLLDVKCPKCGHDKAYFMTMQTRASDEPETKFFKCEKCSYSWRDYD